MALAEGDAKRRVAKYEAMAQEAGKD
jgi:hypothetical protein